MSVPNVFCRSIRKYVGDKSLKVFFSSSKNDPSKKVSKKRHLLLCMKPESEFFRARKLIFIFSIFSIFLISKKTPFLPVRSQSAKKNYFFLEIVRKNGHSIGVQGGTLVRISKSGKSRFSPKFYLKINSLS